MTFEGNVAIQRKALINALEEDIASMRRHGLDKAAADDASFGLREYYHSQGYPQARIDYAYSPLEGGGAAFLIAEGPRIEIDRVKIQGVHDLPWRDLTGVDSARDFERFFKPVLRHLWGPRKRIWYVAAEVARAQQELRDFLRSAGYLDTRIEELQTEFRLEEGEVDLTVQLRPGRRHYLAEVRFDYQNLQASGSAATPTPVEGVVDRDLQEQGRASLESRRPDLGAILTTRLGQAFAPQTAWTLRAKVIEVFRRKGHPDCLVRFEERRERGRVFLRYWIDPGPVVTIGDVRLLGFRETKLPFARARVGVEPSSPYDSTAIRKAFRSLYRTGVFESVRIELEDTDGSERDLEVEVVEAPGREIFIEPGYGSYERARILVGGRERNLLGTGKVLAVEGKLGERAQGGQLSLTDPWFLGKDLVSTYALFIQRREQPSFTRREVGFTTGVTEEWSPELSTTLGYQYRLTNITDVIVDDEEALEALSDVDISSVSLTLTWDGRDDVFVPSSGLRTRSILEWGGEEIGSELDFARFNFEVAHFQPLGEGRVLGAGLGFGVIWPLGNSDVIPLQERFFNGGEDTVRSFREDELGPRDSSGTPIGGEAFTVGSIELRQRLVGNLETAFFTDLGSVSEFAEDVFSGDDYSWGVGIGLRYLLPIGPMRLDGAFNPDAGSDDDDFVLHFAVGMSF